jgi:Sodium:neurotransmitter symporter family
MVLIYLCVFQGVKGSGKVAIVTVSLPYVLLIILFFRGVTLSGAGTGIKYYLQPVRMLLGRLFAGDRLLMRCVRVCLALDRTVCECVCLTERERECVCLTD